MLNRIRQWFRVRKLRKQLDDYVSTLPTERQQKAIELRRKLDRTRSTTAALGVLENEVLAISIQQVKVLERLERLRER